MPIRMVTRDFRAAPSVFCDHCSQLIATAADGNAEFPRVLEKEGIADVFFTHKHCSDAFRAAYQSGQANLGSIELSAFALYLGNNLSVDWKAAGDTAARFSEF